MENQDILLAPHLSEKATGIAERFNKVSFRVAKAARKHQIRQAVEQIYGVKVEAVHTLVLHGKVKRRGSSIGRLPNWKKAIVTLKKGDVIDFFATE